MRALASLLRRKPALPAEQQARLERWQTGAAPDLKRPIEDTRLLVVDVETSGLDLRRDRLLSVGAVPLQAGRLAVGEVFHVVLQQEQASERANILIHGIGPTAQAQGTPPAEALLAFLEYAGKAPLVAFHAPFDQAMLNRAARAQLGLARLPHAWLDLAWLLPALFPGTVRGRATLDEWLAHFGLLVSERHSAEADALATGELLLIALKRARQQGAGHFSALSELARTEAKVTPGGGLGGM